MKIMIVSSDDERSTESWTKDKMWTKGTLKGDGISTPRPRRSSAAVPDSGSWQGFSGFRCLEVFYPHIPTYVHTDRQTGRVDTQQDANPFRFVRCYEVS